MLSDHFISDLRLASDLNHVRRCVSAASSIANLGVVFEWISFALGGANRCCDRLGISSFGDLTQFRMCEFSAPPFDCVPFVCDSSSDEWLACYMMAPYPCCRSSSCFEVGSIAV